MREKTQKFMTMVFAPFEQTAAGLVGQLREKFAAGFEGQLPPEATESVAVLEKAINDGRGAIETKIAEVVEKHLTEADLDVLIAHRETAEEKKLSDVSFAIMSEITELTGTWIMETGRSVEGELMRLLGEAPAPAPEPPQAA